MKIVIAHNRYSSAQPSGENTVVDAEIAALRAAGLTVVPFLRSSDEIADLSTVGKLALAVSPVYAARAQKELSALLRAERPDVLHLHNVYPFLSPAVVRTAHRHGVPVVQTIHNVRHECLNGLYFRDGRICHDCAGKRVDLPGILHGCYRGSRAQSVIMATSLAAHKGTWRSVDAFVALTPWIADYLVTFGVGRERIVVKPNSSPDPGPPTAVGDGFVYVGRLSAEKGIEAMLAAWSRFPVGSLGQLTIVGDGPLRAMVEEAAALRADVNYLGRQPREHVDAAVRDASALLLPSMWEDILPTVAIEALANARPVLATNLGGMPYLVGDAGWIVEPTVDGLANGLARARDEAADLAGIARARWESTFAPEVVTGQLIKIYEGVAAGVS
ncbi:glycosyl transferase [Actinorhabdospora filicis]|uniref:Glycosyl transferase n=1 Tax=Actinorhabdospora filicis TaxID=1785913 RepID=A0A9W6SSW0_9ACTN|nr:glycosyltransferase family 4 protein [Actinorhabdospora filicis]GLZ81354.1 glycosyl transferase [Actinorhabdospora filicis]